MISRRVLRIKILQLLYAYYKSTDPSINKFEKELFHSINKTYELYHFLLLLITEIADYAQGRIDIALQKNFPTQEDLNPNTRFVENKIIQQLRKSKELQSFLRNNRMSWVNYPELIKKLYSDMREADFYMAHMCSQKCTYEDDRKFISNLLIEVVANCDDLYTSLEEQSIYWNDEVEFVISIIIKTIKGFRETDIDNVSLLPLFKNEDDIDFTKKLYRKSILRREEYLSLIKEYTKNWEIERIAAMDVMLLQLAIAEVTEFPSIPTKVTFNEYLELAKHYSTNKSSMFINGVLDKIIKHLRDSDQIKKLGRGLVGENRSPDL